MDITEEMLEENLKKIRDKVEREPGFETKLLSAKTLEEASALLKEKGVVIEDEILMVLGDMIKNGVSEEKVELSEDELDIVAAGFGSSTGTDGGKVVCKGGSYMGSTSDYSGYMDDVISDYRKKSKIPNT